MEYKHIKCEIKENVLTITLNRPEKLNAFTDFVMVPELLDAFELLHMLNVSTLVLNGGLAREESRGAHYREDFPARDDARWLVNIVFSKKGEDLDTRYEKVDLSRIGLEA